MLKRYSIVNDLEGVTLAFSSVYQIGDSQNIYAQSKAFAVQREKEFFLSSEGSFDSDVFQKPITLPAINPQVSVNRLNLCPIKVNNMFIRATSASSVIHIGNTRNVYMEARVKNIRQLENGSAPQTFETIQDTN
ncbi:spore germination protein GerPE [Rossellomorea sp. AcN35-11]|nr:spore germination protein GerPE [Rossellomorea aquimaris]NMH69511.1 spore germination protein GerPE [Bacillus sp. RO3]WJV29237.1 spore germination protein GerPE [Rossellomorea sp. AcN35-11]